MPECGIDFVKRDQLLSYEEILRLSRILSQNGVNKVRITGGEPFVRRDLVPFLTEMTKISGLDSLHITTNGTVTERHLDEIQRLGIKVNLSLDSINPDTNYQITRRHDLNTVLSCLEGLNQREIPTKINAVVMSGINDGEIQQLAELAVDRPIEVRFLEEMPFNGAKRGVVSKWNAPAIIEELQNHFPGLKLLDFVPGETARRLIHSDWKGSLGVIASYSRSFCGSCNRIRITATGEIRTCLYSNEQHSLRDFIRQTENDDEVLKFIQAALMSKSRDGFGAEKKRARSITESMASIGG